MFMRLCFRVYKTEFYFTTLLNWAPSRENRLFAYAKTQAQISIFCGCTTRIVTWSETPKTCSRDSLDLTFDLSRDDTQILTTKVNQTTANISLYMVPILQGVQSRMVLVVNIYVFLYFSFNLLLLYVTWCTMWRLNMTIYVKRASLIFQKRFPDVVSS